jgi:ribonuclease HI
MDFYAVHRGKSVGVFTTWEDCKKSIDGYSHAIFKKFSNIKEANEFVEKGHGEFVVQNHFENENFVPNIIVFTDGACINNGKPDALAGIGVFFAENDPRNYSGKISGKQSNNCAEIKAILKAFIILKRDIEKGKNVLICSDSTYAIRCCTTYGQKCFEKNWDESIPNVELVKASYELFKNIKNVQFKYVKAHTDNNDFFSIGNSGADKLANMAIGAPSCPYNSKEVHRIYLRVKYEEKDEAKALGARWDKDSKSWYILSNLEDKFKELLFEKFEKL